MTSNQNTFSRRSFLRSLAAVSAGVMLSGKARPALAALPDAKISKVRIFSPPQPNPIFNQSNMIVIVEADNGMFGIGEGGARDTLEQCASRLIGKNPFDIERCWQDMYRSFFYPPGKEKIHALGALDLALWDMKGKALDLPVHDLLGGMARKYFECYSTTWGIGSVRERAKSAMDAGYRAYRMDAASLRGTDVYEVHNRVRQVVEDCKSAREGVGKDGDWLIDFHQRFDFNDGLRCCKMIEEYEPYLVEDPVRTEAFLEDIPKIRAQTIVPLAAGEEWGQRWDFNKLIENHDIDYMRGTLPNVGGITEMQKIAALCETHFIGIVPHFTGPIATAALTHVLGPYSGPVLMEFNYPRPIDYLPECLDFKDGKVLPNKRPGLGVTLKMDAIKLVSEVTEAGTGRQLYFRPDGSMTNW